MQILEVSDAVRPIYGSLGVKRLIEMHRIFDTLDNCKRPLQPASYPL